MDFSPFHFHDTSAASTRFEQGRKQTFLALSPCAIATTYASNMTFRISEMKHVLFLRSSEKYRLSFSLRHIFTLVLYSKSYSASNLRQSCFSCT
jgi:hypothetical protein